MDLVKVVGRLWKIRKAKRLLEKKEAEVKETLVPLVKAAGGTLKIGGFVLKLTTTTTYRYGELLDALIKERPDIAAIVESLKPRFATTYDKLEIANSED